MKAIVHTKYGSPEVAKLVEVPKPTPKNNEVLIKVFTSTVNRTDSGFRSAEYFISRFWSGFLIIAENKAIEKIPDNLTFNEAAPISEGAHYALCNIRASKIKNGQKALVYGATGAIGSSAVQILRYFGVSVTAVCNTKNVELLKSLGADKVIDYQMEDFTQIEDKYHFIFDAVGKSSFKECKPLLTEKGIYVSTELGKNAENIFLALFTPLFRGRKVIFPIPTIDKQDLLFLKQLVEKGEYKPVIDREYRLEQIVDAYKYVETGQKTGNVILKIVE